MGMRSMRTAVRHIDQKRRQTNVVRSIGVSEGKFAELHNTFHSASAWLLLNRCALCVCVCFCWTQCQNWTHIGTFYSRLAQIWWNCDFCFSSISLWSTFGMRHWTGWMWMMMLEDVSDRPTDQPTANGFQSHLLCVSAMDNRQTFSARLKTLTYRRWVEAQQKPELAILFYHLSFSCTFQHVCIDV